MSEHADEFEAARELTKMHPDVAVQIQNAHGNALKTFSDGEEREDLGKGYSTGVRGLAEAQAAPDFDPTPARYMIGMWDEDHSRFIRVENMEPFDSLDALAESLGPKKEDG
jgi:hypothetical protein